MAKKEKGQPLNAQQKMSKMITNLVIIIVVMTVISALLIFLGLTYVMGVIFIGMLPSLVANFIEKRKKRLASKSITAFNLAGMLPHFFALGKASNPNSAAQGMINDPYTWLMVYGFASFGWIVVHIIPQLAFLYLTIKADFTVRKLQGMQRTLVDEWGEKVKNKN